MQPSEARYVLVFEKNFYVFRIQPHIFPMFQVQAAVVVIYRSATAACVELSLKFSRTQLE